MLELTVRVQVLDKLFPATSNTVDTVGSGGSVCYCLSDSELLLLCCYFSDLWYCLYSIVGGGGAGRWDGGF